MSWSVQFVGKPDAVVRALEGHIEKNRLTGQSKAEYEEALPALKTLVQGNAGLVVVNLVASGHASFQDGVKTSGSVSVKLDPCYGLVE